MRPPALRAVVLCVLFGAIPAGAQEVPVRVAGEDGTEGAPGHRVVAAGFIGPAIGEYVGGGVSLAFLGERSGWLLRWERYEEFTIFGPDPALSVWAFSVQPAIGVGAGILQGTASAGVALVGGMNRGRYLGSDGGWFGTSHYEEAPFVTIGGAAVVDVTLALLPFLGVGAEFSAQLNPGRSYAGVGLRVTAGRLR